MNITLRDDCIVFKEYPFFSLELEQNNNILHAKDIAEISINDLMSVVRTENELILISYLNESGDLYLKDDALKEFAAKNSIAVINRYPIITDILAYFTEQEGHNTPMLIDKYHVTKCEVFSVRLLFYLFKGNPLLGMHMMQDWYLWDFLDAALPLRWIPLVGKRIFRKVYMFSMRVALKAYI
jgi:hypothetical protein